MICPHVEAADRDERVQMMGRQPNLLVENAHVEIECAKIRLLEPRKPPEDDDVHADHRLNQLRIVAGGDDRFSG